ncbi:unnamed protein product [Hermetia illucens]|uniref:Uncharacterized protein n=1 Tax=Hermetia illucens TaxID=343691 RepID=A0A7R8YN43_HERIL|nr:unnamed protein product [Hermetia illucens]
MQVPARFTTCTAHDKADKLQQAAMGRGPGAGGRRARGLLSGCTCEKVGSAACRSQKQQIIGRSGVIQIYLAEVRVSGKV